MQQFTLFALKFFDVFFNVSSIFRICLLEVIDLYVVMNEHKIMHLCTYVCIITWNQDDYHLLLILQYTDYTDVDIQTDTRTHPLMHTDTDGCVCTHPHAQTDTYTHTQIDTHAHTQTDMHARTDIQTRTQTCSHTRAHTCRHTDRQMCVHTLFLSVHSYSSLPDEVHSIHEVASNVPAQSIFFLSIQYITVENTRLVCNKQNTHYLLSFKLLTFQELATCGNYIFQL